MSLYTDIEKATRVPRTEERPTFVKIKDKKVNKRQRTQRNRNISTKNTDLMEDDNFEIYHDIIDNRKLNETEIANSIKAANGGITYSNDVLEDHWKSRQTKANLCSETWSSRSENDTCSFGNTSNLKSNLESNSESSVAEDNSESNTSKSEDSVVEVQNPPKICKLLRNAAIVGLLNNGIITVDDLKCPRINREPDRSNNNKPKGEASSSKNGNVGDSYVKLVPCPDDPDVLVHPLQAHGTIDESKHKDIDFTVARVGKKKIVTPQMYYTYEIDDSFFAFVKKGPSSK